MESFEICRSKNVDNIILSLIISNSIICVLLLIGPVFIFVGIPPFILSILCFINIQRAITYRKDPEQQEKLIKSLYLSTNYIKYSLYLLLAIYGFLFILLNMIYYRSSNLYISLVTWVKNFFQ